jgi:hypothetical protein
LGRIVSAFAGRGLAQLYDCVAPLEMNVGTYWGKNTIDPSGRGIEMPRKVTLTFNLLTCNKILFVKKYFSLLWLFTDFSILLFAF